MNMALFMKSADCLLYYYLSAITFSVDFFHPEIPAAKPEFPSVSGDYSSTFLT